MKSSGSLGAIRPRSKKSPKSAKPAASTAAQGRDTPKYTPLTKRDPDLSDALRPIRRSIARLRSSARNSGLAKRLDFTIDGRLVGDLGELLASRYYDVELYPKQRKRHDGETSDGRKVEVKATFRGKLALRLEPDYLLGFQLRWDGTFTEVYNGPGCRVRKYCDPDGHRQRSITVEELQGLNEPVADTDRIARRCRPRWSSAARALDKRPPPS